MSKANKKKRPRDVVGNAVHVMKIATGEIEDEAETDDDGKSKAAVELGRKRGTARAKKLTKEQRSEIARKAAAKPGKSPPAQNPVDGVTFFLHK